jgi:hypothetical protein
MREGTLRFAQRSIFSFEDGARSRYHCSRDRTSASCCAHCPGIRRVLKILALKGLIFVGRVPQQAEFATTLVGSG